MSTHKKPVVPREVVSRVMNAVAKRGLKKCKTENLFDIHRIREQHHEEQKARNQNRPLFFLRWPS